MAAVFNQEFLPAVGTVQSLADLPNGQEARVLGLQAKAPGTAAILLRLAELGFLKGERVCVVARGFPGREPLAVRVGSATFALRRAEAECIQVSAPSLHHG
jgi:ferrous iron transport protein A